MNFACVNLFLSTLFPLAEFSLLIDLLKYKNIQDGINFHCNSVNTEMVITKLFYNNQIMFESHNYDHNKTFTVAHRYQRLGMILNASCSNWFSILDNFRAKSMFKSPFTWFIVTNDLNSTVDVLSQYPIEIDSDVTIIHKVERKIFDLYVFYNTGFYTGGKVKFNKIGHWNSSLKIKTERRTDLSGVVLKCTVVITQKVVNETFEAYTEKSKLSKSDTLHKLKYFTVLKYLRDMYEMSYELHRTNSWGYLRNGSFDGMIGSLQRGESDIGGSPIFFRQERAKVLDATIEVWPSRPVFILRHPKHPSGYYTIFTRPLTARVWCCITAILTLASALLCVMMRVRALRRPGDDADASSSLALLTIWSAVCQQGSTMSRSSTSIKLVIFVTFLFTLTIYQYYNATVVSTLLREPPKNIRTPQDLLNSNLKAGVHDVLYNRDFFNRTTDPIALQMYKKKIVTHTSSNFFSLEYGMALVKRGGFAFLVDNSIAYGVMRNTFDESELCDAHEIVLYPPQNMVAVVKKGSPYKELFSYGLRKTFEAGLMRRIKSEWDAPRPRCVRTADTRLVAVTAREFSTPLVALAAGMLTALIVLFAELAVSILRSTSRAPREQKYSQRIDQIARQRYRKTQVPRIGSQQLRSRVLADKRTRVNFFGSSTHGKE